jgi:aspartate/methionine/tyrosine aminotransferase
MKLPDFELERFFARWEFEAPYLLCTSDVEPLSLTELLALADDEGRALWDELRLGYTESSGHPLLREAIASLYLAIEPSEVHAFAGAEEAIFVLLNVMLGPGDHAIVTWPAYQSLHEVARATGAEVTLLRLEEASGWALDLDALRRAMRPSTRVIVVNFPHNPTGALPDRRTFTEVMDLAREAGCWVLSDEVYRGLEFEPDGWLPAAADICGRAVSVGVLSKTYALAGLRLGWIATRDAELRRRAAAFKDYTTICNAAPSEVLGIIALRAHERIRARSVGIVRENLAHVDRFFADFSDVLAWRRPRAGSVAFPRFFGDVDVDALALDLVREEGVLLAPGSVFGAPGPHFRLGLGRRNLPEALERFGRFVARRLR